MVDHVAVVRRDDERVLAVEVLRRCIDIGAVCRNHNSAVARIGRFCKCNAVAIRVRCRSGAGESRVLLGRLLLCGDDRRIVHADHHDEVSLIGGEQTVAHDELDACFAMRVLFRRDRDGLVARLTGRKRNLFRLDDRRIERGDFDD